MNRPYELTDDDRRLHRPICSRRTSFTAPGEVLALREYPRANHQQSIPARLSQRPPRTPGYGPLEFGLFSAILPSRPCRKTDLVSADGGFVKQPWQRGVKNGR